MTLRETLINCLNKELQKGQTNNMETAFDIIRLGMDLILCGFANLQRFSLDDNQRSALINAIILDLKEQTTKENTNETIH